jgi:sigma-B regulation protein RsbU (phosphoserine phosphatase)
MHGNKTLVETRFRSDPDQLRNIRDTIRAVLRKNNCPPLFIDDLVLAVNEACANIMQHSYKGKCTGEIILAILRKQDEITVRLTDFAEPVDTSACKSRQLDELRPGGLGVHFMNELMDDVRFLETQAGVGNILLMKKKITTRHQGN